MKNHIELQDIIRPVQTIPVTANLKETLSQMLKEHTNSLFVIDRDGKLVGIVTVLDILKEITPDYLEDKNVIMSSFVTEDMFIEDVRKCENTLVSTFMRSDTPIVDQQASVVEAILRAMSNERSRVAVVDQEGRPVGMLTRTEIKSVLGDYLDLPTA
jgi:predicted transcriptional regulator